MHRSRVLRAGSALLLAATLGACSDSDEQGLGVPLYNATAAGGPVLPLKNTSSDPALVKVMAPGVEAFSVIGSDDVLPGSPGFVFGGSADGAGLLRNTDGTFTMIVNHEDNFAVSRVLLDSKFQPLQGDYLLSSNDGLFRLCSATLVRPEEHGFGPLFLTAGESNEESQSHAVNPYGAASASDRLLPALGRWNAENVVPLPSAAYPGRTVVMIGDDDSGEFGGQLALYLGGTVGDLDNGRVFVMARRDGVTRERDMVVGQRYAVEFKEVTNIQARTGRQVNEESGRLGAIAFGRVEDIDYRKSGTGREIYFNVTGQNTTGFNADYSRSKYGRVYRLTLDPQRPTSGTLEVVLDGDDRSGPAGQFQNPDNIVVTRRFVYIQEDPNGYGDESHDSYVYQYDIVKGTLAVVMELDHKRDLNGGANKYNQRRAGAAYSAAPSRLGSWEYGAMLDVSDLLGGNGDRGTFLISVQPHTWIGAKYRGVDGGTLRPNEDQASQMIVVTGLPR